MKVVMEEGFSTSLVGNILFVRLLILLRAVTRQQWPVAAEAGLAK
jgi:hypothetical protein